MEQSPTNLVGLNGLLLGWGPDSPDPAEQLQGNPCESDVQEPGLGGSAAKAASVEYDTALHFLTRRIEPYPALHYCCVAASLLRALLLCFM